MNDRYACIPYIRLSPPSWLGRLWSGRTGSWLRMNRLSSRNNRLKFKTVGKITDHFRGIYGIYPNSIKEHRMMWTCNRLDLQTLGSQPVMLKNLPDHWARPGRGLAASKQGREVIRAQAGEGKKIPCNSIQFKAGRPAGPSRLTYWILGQGHAQEAWQKKGGLHMDDHCQHGTCVLFGSQPLLVLDETVIATSRQIDVRDRTDVQYHSSNILRRRKKRKNLEK